MRALWPIERAALEATAIDDPKIADCILRQVEAATVTSFENSGAGFFSTIGVAADVPLLPDKSPLDAGAHGSVDGIEHGMGFIVFVERGRLSLLEGYSYGDVSTVGLDFEHVTFDVKPWSKAQTTG